MAAEARVRELEAQLAQRQEERLTVGPPAPRKRFGNSHSPTGVQYVKPQLFTDTIYFPKRNAKKQKPAAIKTTTKKRTPSKDPSPKRTPLSPEAKREKNRKRDREKRSTAKALGLCRDCPQPAIDGLTRCEKHQADLLAYSRGRRAAAKQSENSPRPKPPARGVQRQLLLPVPSIILAGSPPVSDCAAGPLRCGSWGRRIPG